MIFEEFWKGTSQLFAQAGDIISTYVSPLHCLKRKNKRVSISIGFFCFVLFRISPHWKNIKY